MAIAGRYLGMNLRIEAQDFENTQFFGYCANGDFRLQACDSCALLRYPPTTGCPWCGGEAAQWTPVEGRGTVYTYAEVPHAIQPAFRDHLPYLILLVELDTQRGRPTEGEALRVTGNLVAPDGVLAAPDPVRRVGIGSRVRMVFNPVADGLALPQWTLDEAAEPPDDVWRYPQ